ncbi:MAG: hypothetical protein Q8R82_20850 [Hyphomonadaceae bacterium]|nr:hypothetical protein [Hyphomonadaceae bacterium]
MSVLKLRRDMVVVDEEPAADTVAEIEKPFPLRKIEPEDANIIEGELTEPADHHDDDDHHEKTFFGHVRFWFNATVIVAAIGAYPAMVVASSDVGDHSIGGVVNRSDWTAPWAGGVSALMEKHFNELGWAADAPGWSPMARLTAKPAYQSAMASSLGDFIKLTNAQAVAAGRPDQDLEAASRLVSSASTGIQLQAARDALTNYDRRLRRRDVSSVSTSSQVSAQLGLIASWALASQEEIAASAKAVGGNPIDEDATRAVYSAKGRAAVAYTILASLQWPETPAAAKAREAALEAWKSAARFHPLIVLNGDPDGSLFGNHATSMGFLLGQAQKATNDFLTTSASVAPPPSAAPAPPAAAASTPASGASR